MLPPSFADSSPLMASGTVGQGWPRRRHSREDVYLNALQRWHCSGNRKVCRALFKAARSMAGEFQSNEGLLGDSRAMRGTLGSGHVVARPGHAGLLKLVQVASLQARPISSAQPTAPGASGALEGQHLLAGGSQPSLQGPYILLAETLHVQIRDHCLRPPTCQPPGPLRCRPAAAPLLDAALACMQSQTGCSTRL